MRFGNEGKRAESCCRYRMGERLIRQALSLTSWQLSRPSAWSWSGERGVRRAGGCGD